MGAGQSFAGLPPAQHWRITERSREYDFRRDGVMDTNATA